MAEWLDQSAHLAASLPGHVKQSQRCGQRGTGALARLAGGGAIPSPLICREGPAHLNLVFCARPWLPRVPCRSGRPKRWHAQALLRSRRAAPTAHSSTPGAPDASLAQAVPLCRAGSWGCRARAEASSEASSSCPSLLQGLIAFPSQETIWECGEGSGKLSWQSWKQTQACGLHSPLPCQVLPSSLLCPGALRPASTLPGGPCLQEMFLGALEAAQLW